MLTPSSLSCSADGVARATSSLFSELRGILFSKVVQSGIRSLASRTFEHLHSLDLNFHLNRNTGALNRSIDRGSRFGLREEGTTNREDDAHDP